MYWCLWAHWEVQCCCFSSLSESFLRPSLSMVDKMSVRFTAPCFLMSLLEYTVRYILFALFVWRTFFFYFCPFYLENFLLLFLPLLTSSLHFLCSFFVEFLLVERWYFWTDLMTFISPTLTPIHLFPVYILSMLLSKISPSVWNCSFLLSLFSFPRVFLFSEYRYISFISCFMDIYTRLASLRTLITYIFRFSSNSCTVVVPQSFIFCFSLLHDRNFL